MATELIDRRDIGDEDMWRGLGSDQTNASKFLQHKVVSEVSATSASIAADPQFPVLISRQRKSDKQVSTSRPDKYCWPSSDEFGISAINIFKDYYTNRSKADDTGLGYLVKEFRHNNHPNIILNDVNNTIVFFDSGEEAQEGQEGSVEPLIGDFDGVDTRSVNIKSVEQDIDELDAYICKRNSLVDKKYDEGLSAEEDDELERLTKLIRKQEPAVTKEHIDFLERLLKEVKELALKR